MAKFIEEFYYGNLDPPPRHRNRQPRTNIQLTKRLHLMKVQPFYRFGNKIFVFYICNT